MRPRFSTRLMRRGGRGQLKKNLAAKLPWSATAPCTFAAAPSFQACLRAFHMYILYVCVHKCVCVYVCGHVYMYIYACVYVFVHLCVHTHVYVYVNAPAHIQHSGGDLPDGVCVIVCCVSSDHPLTRWCCFVHGHSQMQFGWQILR